MYHLDNCCRACRETPNGKLYSTESSLNKISARFKVWKMSEWSHLLDLFTFPSPVSCWLLPHCFHILADLSFSHASEWTPWINLWTWNVFEFSSDFSQVSWYLPPCYVIYSTAVEEIGGNTLPWPWMRIVILSTYVSIQIEFSSDFSQVSWYLPPCYVIYSTAVEEIGGNTLPWPWMHIVILSTYVSI